MPSTFTANLGIELPADGELDGVWGGVVNENMDILDRAINGSISLSLSGTSSTLTTSDGALSNGQFKLLALGGSPSGTHTITISPNDAQKIYYVYNLTAQSVVFTQGSGGNVTIAAGDSGIIYSNGGGASAAVVNITDHFAMSSVAITGGTISGITDLAIADGGTGASNAATALTNLGAQAAITGAATTVTTSNLTASRALASDGSGKIAVSAVTATELGYLTGVTSAIQTQLGARQPLDATLTALAALDATGGVITQTAADTFVKRSIAGTTNQITITNGDGVSGNPTAALAATLAVTSTIADDGTPASGATYTPSPVGGNFKRIINGSSPSGFTLAAPTASGDYTMIILVTNNASAGAITLSNFSRTTGSPFTTTNGHQFLLYITKVTNTGPVAVELVNVVALQ